ncbi:phosphate ABC transporter substrate-binding protein [Bacillota bacterium LX-D]|nr:phosphate ABC transporter substrate-binding protein [Bacillota bacterium LX-D]
MLKKASKIMTVMMLLGILTAGLVGCGGSKTEGGDNGASEEKTTITVAGSTSVQPVAQELADAFMETHQNITINVQGGGSGVGIESASNGAADIGTSSRELKPEEKPLKEFAIAKDGIAIVVNPQNSLTDISKDQLQKIYAGEITNWKDINGKDAPIAVITREESSGTRGAFQELVMGKDAQGNEIPIVNSAIVQNGTGAVKQGVATNANAIGFISLGAIDDTVKAVSIDQVKPSKETVLAGTYKLQRPFLFLTKEEPTGAVKEFIDFVLSPEGQNIVGKEFIAVK